MKNNKPNFKRTKHTCYSAYLTMSSVFSLPPLLFLTFRENYGFSFTQLGSLVLINFCTQMIIDLIFTFFSKYFNIHKTIRTMPVLTSIGMLIYALIPTLFPQYAYAGLVTGTVIFSVSAGLSEVLLSPLVAALPSETPERDMSLLHSLYAYGVLIVVVISTIFLKIFGKDNWMYLTIFWALLPLISFVLFCTSPLPDMNISHAPEAGGAKKRNFGIILCVMCIFLGSASENVMTNWISGYMETVLGIPKAVGDVLGMASFAVLLGVSRSLYAKYGKNISSTLLAGMAGAAVCYLVAGLCPNIIISMAACILTGMFTSMLWPGTLILMEEKFPSPGVTAYALMAAGGDFGASVAPQMLGVITDKVEISKWATTLSESLSVAPEQIGMKTGMVITAIFPILGVILLIYMKKYFRKNI